MKAKNDTLIGVVSVIALAVFVAISRFFGSDLIDFALETIGATVILAVFSIVLVVIIGIFSIFLGKKIENYCSNNLGIAFIIIFVFFFLAHLYMGYKLAPLKDKFYSIADGEPSELYVPGRWPAYEYDYNGSLSGLVSQRKKMIKESGYVELASWKVSGDIRFTFVISINIYTFGIL